MADLPPVPLTIEGSAVLHQMFRIKWPAWKKAPVRNRESLVAKAAAVLESMERGAESGHPNQSALFSMLGHKCDLMMVHFRDRFDELNRIELTFAQLEFFEYLEPVHSYLSVVELGLYDSSAKTYAQLAERGVAPFSPDWNAAIQEVMARQSEAMSPRLYPPIPGSKYVCFYPMDRKRGEAKNWYTESMADRQRMMHDHGMIGRRYADSVRQIITGSIGFDDWEWGVDLFADDPLVFKKLIYEMRFDEVSAVYALFGAFYVGVRVPAANLGGLLEGTLPL
ncbi:MAG TPA: hydrogen peroxide-dependent heme synthase [Bryobacteraceae bacterium]|jgi:chlorite dismutase|nr:hydrogen peroxide-dependent heme synthase [Bryobacteraceae bacterium]